MAPSVMPDWAEPESSASASAKGAKSAGAWPTLGVSPTLTRSLNLRGFKHPTPIQRSSIPLALAHPPRDVLGMARTGSGKTLAYMIPLLSKLGGHQSGGARAIILCPNRELAMQILKVGKDLGRGMKKKRKSKKQDDDAADDGEGEEEKQEDLRWAIIMGGEGLDAQFEAIARGPDVIIATPGRFLHVCVEMSLDLRSVEMIVYDEADRLFELGFATQLTEIMHRLPTTRHSLLFSATLPTSLAEFANAGLNNPALIRLDADHRISPDLRLAFFAVKPVEKEAGLLLLLREVVKIPAGDKAAEAVPVKKKGGKYEKNARDPGRPQAIIFVATKHHVEFVSTLLATASYRVSSIYGSLDQVARKEQLENFRRGETDLLVVTDVAARGLDIPIMANVVNYDFPTGVRLFVHRVGRTARAGQKGTAWSLITKEDLPYLYELETFLDRPLVVPAGATDDEDSGPDGLGGRMFGTMPRERIDADVEHIRSGLEDAEQHLPALREVMRKGESMFLRSRSKASSASYKKAKAHNPAQVEVHPVFRRTEAEAAVGDLMDLDDTTERDEARRVEEKRKALVEGVINYRPAETVFEIGARGNTEGATIMKGRRVVHERRIETKKKADAEKDKAEAELAAQRDPKKERSRSLMEAALENNKDKFRDPAFFMPHEKLETARDKGYSLNEGGSFAEQARHSTLDMTGDESNIRSGQAQKASQLTWDRKNKKFMKDPGVGKDNKKMIRGESGVILPASYRSGRFDEWRKKRGRVDDGEGADRGDAKRWRHKGKEAGEDAPRRVSKNGKGGVEREERGGKRGTAKGMPEGKPAHGRAGGSKKTATGSGLLSADAVRKKRQMLEKRRDKNARRPSKGKGRR